MNKLYQVTILVPQTRAVLAEDIKYAFNVAKATTASIKGAVLTSIEELTPPEKKNDNQ